MPNPWSVQDERTGRFVAQAPKPCAVDGCTRPLLARGWCNSHYRRWMQSGSTELKPLAKDQPCAVGPCSRLAHARGLCFAHYERLLTTGGVAEGAPIRVAASLEDRFWPKVDKSGDCWVWTAATDEHGYGKFWVKSLGKMVKAHRAAWLIVNGSMPSGNLLHACDNPPCVNPAHLRLGTQADNVADAKERGRMSPPPHYSGGQNPAYKHGRYARPA